MKHITWLILFFAVFTTVASAAIVPHAYSFNKLVIQGNLHIELVEDSSQVILVEGSEAFKSAVSLKYQNGQLIIRSTYDSKSPSDRIIIGVVALKKLILEGASTITSRGYIESPDLLIDLRSEASVNLLCRGKYKLRANDDLDITWVKNQ